MAHSREAAARSGANRRTLDPNTAYQVHDQPGVRATVFVADALLVRGRHPETYAALEAVTLEAGFELVRDEAGALGRELLERAELTKQQRTDLEAVWVERVQLAPRRDRPESVFRPIDTWRLLQSYRAYVGRESERHGDVGLEHPATSSDVQPTPYTDPHPYTNPHPYTDPHEAGPQSSGLQQYGRAGSGGRQPVSWLGLPPQRRIAEGDTTARRPVVAVFDSSVGEHPWLGPEHVERDPEVLGAAIGLPPDPADVEAGGTTEALVGELGRDAGHGTFIAGLIRQGCPDALVLAVRLFQSDGVVDESELLRSLQLLALRHLLGVNGVEGYAPVDVLSVSLGYYHEQPEDSAFDALLHGPLALLGRYGVCVVVSAGNDATTRPAYPAAFAPYPGGSVADDEACIPVAAVGALNPDRSIAMFSNDGPWVRFLRPGAALVSTFPVTYNASQSASNQVRTTTGEVRRSLDPDDYSAGFAVWSGTSFSAPVLAAEVAERLQREFEAGDAGADPIEAVARGRRVLTTLPGRVRP